jgi:hypothetical protein
VAFKFELENASRMIITSVALSSTIRMWTGEEVMVGLVRGLRFMGWRAM